jgi:hypothetical protein
MNLIVGRPAKLPHAVDLVGVIPVPAQVRQRTLRIAVEHPAISSHANDLSKQEYTRVLT